MKIKNSFFPAVLALCALSLFAFKGYEKEKVSDIVWLEISHPKKNVNYYLEADSNGNLLMREIFGKKIVVRRGTVKKMFFNDFYREVRNSEIVTQQNLDTSKMMFYKGEVIKLSAYISGELKRVSSPMNKFSEAFIYAFNELKKQAYKIKPGTPPAAFITSVPLDGPLYDDFQKKASKDYKLLTMEAKELRSNLHLFKSVNEPHRMIPLESEDEVSELSDFIYNNKLFGMKSLFYIGTTRGNFQCSVLDAK